MKKLDYAESYLIDHNLSIVPLNYKRKNPKIKWNKYRNVLMKPQKIKKYFGKSKYSNIGIVTGKISNIIVLDIDKKNNGLETLKELEIPDTVTVKTGGGGFHYFFQYPEGFDKISNFQNEEALPGIDLRADGGYVVAPPSVHPNGERYRFVAGKNFGEIDIAQAPSWLIEFIKSKKKPIKPKSKDKSFKDFYGNKNNYPDNENIFSKINDIVPIVDLWNEYGDGQKLNSNNKIICPFHNDSDPSLSFNIEENYFHCFGCGAGGGPVNLIQMTKNVEPLEAVKIISNSYGIGLDNIENLDETDLKERLKRKEETEKILTRVLKKGYEAINDSHINMITEKYGINKETIKKLKAGYISDIYSSEFNGLDKKLLWDLNLFTDDGGSRSVNENIRNSIIIPVIENGLVRDIAYISLETGASGLLNESTIFNPSEVLSNDLSR